MSHDHHRHDAEDALGAFLPDTPIEGSWRFGVGALAILALVVTALLFWR
jgi:hypothetical protein